MLNLEEAIEHCEEVAEEQEKMGERNYDDDCLECAKEHRQLAEWLRELEWRRNAMVEIHEAMLMPASMAERISEEVNADDIR
jgi:hypothetical protein